MKPTLLVMAAGLGSRYGGVKQIDAVGMHGETLLDFGVYDAFHADYGKVWQGCIHNQKGYRA